jgi:hypothetical protein
MIEPQSGQIVIGKADSEHLSITISARDAEGWLAGTVEVKVAFELVELQRNPTGRAQLEPMEPHLREEFVGDGRGHVKVKGVARNSFDRETFLAFEFDLDQTESPRIIRILRAADPE